MPFKYRTPCPYEGTSECTNCGDCSVMVECDFCHEDIAQNGDSCLRIPETDLCMCEKCVSKYTVYSTFLYDYGEDE